MPNCHLAGPFDRAAHIVEFSIGEQFDIRDQHRAAKLQRQALIEVKPLCRMRV